MMRIAQAVRRGVMRLQDRGSTSALAATFALVAAIGVVSPGVAQATKYYDSTLGGQSASATGVPPSPAGSAYGGSFSSSSPGVSDVAVNDPAVSSDGAGRAGWVYVVDRGNNRVQAFDQNRVFQWAVGRDVIASAVNEHQNLTVTATGGQFRLEFNGQTTGDLAFGVPASGGSGATASVQNALRALMSVNGTNVNVTGGPGSASGATPYVISFVGTLAAANQPAVTVQPATVALAGTASVSTIVDGTNSVPGDLGVVFEKCTAAFHCKAGVLGSLGGEFNGVQAIDVNQSTGDFFVWERNVNARVQQFDEDGGFIRAFGWDVVASGAGDTGGFETCNATTGAICKAGVTATNFGTANPGQFGSTTVNQAKGIATAPPGAPNAGQLYVADPGSCRIQRFTIPDTTSDTVNAGTPFGLPSDIGAAIADDTFCGTSGIPPVPVPGFPRDVAVDANGVVYGTALEGSGGGMVKRFDATGSGSGTFLSSIGVGGATNQLGDSGGAVTGLEVDPASDHLLIARSAALGIVELDLTDRPATVDPSDVVDRHLLGLGAAPLGLGVGGGRYFLSTSTNVAGTGSGQRILVLDDDGVEPDPVVTINPATGVGSSTATFGGHIDPVITTIFQTSYRWQVSKDGVTWTDVTNDALVGGNGFTPQTVSASATGLEPNTLYRVRIRTTRSPAAGLAFSSEMIFHTDPEPPTVQTRPAQHVSDASAQLIGNLNPGGLTTSYWFEWGDNNYGNQAPVPAGTATGGLDRLVGETITGLTPERVYHYRLCAQNSMTASKVCGIDATFTTKTAATAPAGRSYEIVTAPDKASRRGAYLTTPGVDFSRIMTGLPAINGDNFLAMYFAQPADADAGYGTAVTNYMSEVRHRGADRWSGEAILNISSDELTATVPFLGASWSGDLRTSAWRLGDGLSFTGGSTASVRVLGDDGGPRGGGWYPWLSTAWAPANVIKPTFWTPRIDDTGERMIAQSQSTVYPTPETATLFRDVVPADGGLAADGLTPPQTAGRAVLLGYSSQDWRPGDLVNECTGSGGSATLVPSRDDGGTKSGPAGSWSLGDFFVAAGSTTAGTVSGSTGGAVRVGHYVFGSGIPAGTRVVSVESTGQFTISAPATALTFGLTGGQDTAALANDRISVRPCEEGSPTDVRGANIAVQTRLEGSNAMIMSDDGDRVFFVSPDPTVVEGRDGCEAGDLDVEGGTVCPPQLFVRQLDDAGNPTVRWLSRPEDAMLEDSSGDPQMAPAALGTGVAFEGASRDGSVVYFRTDAPLTEDDPNGGLDPLVEASPSSWDLYRYDLGTDNNADPAPGDPGDRLTRITAGPTGTADPNTNCEVVATSGPQQNNCWGKPNSASLDTEANGEGGVLRFLSDDGDRAYIVTAAQIPGAANNPPAGGSTTPTSVGDQVNVSTRNLYLYDADKSGADAYKFIARLPFAMGTGLNSCASSGSQVSGPQARTASGAELDGRSFINCVHGAGVGDGIVFSTTGQLTHDDSDSWGDVYVYDAGTDELTRLSAPAPGDESYVCSRNAVGQVTGRCNGDLGFATNAAHPEEGPGLAGQRHWNVAQDGQGRLTDVFFGSRLSLVAGDENVAESDVSGGMDVYRWRRADGRLSLVSPGVAGGESAFYNGNSLDGRDVFFWTEQRISPWEIDEADGDIYNATTRDPLPGPPPAPIVCDVLAYACQGGGTGSVQSGSETSSPSSDGNAVSERRSLSVKGLSAKARRRAARSGVLALGVSSTGAGKVTAVAKGRIGKRTRRVASSSVHATGAGTVQLRLRLSSSARKVLSRGKALRLSVDVSSPGVRGRSMTVLLERSR